MRFPVVSVSILAALAQLVFAIPTPEGGRASVTDKADIGYAAAGKYVLLGTLLVNKS
jgi:hypothetical protein